MKVVELNRNNELPSTVRTQLGQFSFFEKLKLKGTGSPRLAYASGHPDLDAIASQSEDLNWCHFECFPNDIVIRFSKKGLRRGLVISYSNIEQVELATWHWIQKRNFKDGHAIIGAIILKHKDGELTFLLNASQVDLFEIYFKRMPIKHKFLKSPTQDKVEIEYRLSRVIRLLDDLVDLL